MALIGAAAEFGFAILHPSAGDSAAQATRGGRCWFAQLGVHVSVPGLVMVDFVAVETVLVAPLYVVKRHGSDVRRWW